MNRLQPLKKVLRLRPFASALALVMVLLFLTLAGCARSTMGDYLKKFAENPELGTFVRGVPFYAQSGQMCGPGALTSIMNFHSAGFKLSEIEGVITNKKLDGSLLVDMSLYAKLKGFIVKDYKGGFTDLKNRLRQKTPPILLVDFERIDYRAGHLVVPIGYDEDQKIVILNSCRSQAIIVSYKKFLRAWKKTDFTTFLITN